MLATARINFCFFDFKDIASLSVINHVDIDLPNNIAVIKGDDPIKNREKGIRILCNDSNISAVVLLERQLDIVDEIILKLKSLEDKLNFKSLNVGLWQRGASGIRQSFETHARKAAQCSEHGLDDLVRQSASYMKKCIR